MSIIDKPDFKKTIESLRKMASDFNKQMEPFKKVFDDLRDIVEKAKANPDSFFSWTQYESTLKRLFWVYPYKIETSLLKTIINDELTEEEFDSFIEKYFNNDVLVELHNEIKPKLHGYNLLLFEQSYNAFLREDYALSCVGFITVMEDLLSFFLKNKGCNKRAGILAPIVNDLSSVDDLSINYFYILMVENNIDEIFRNYDFNKSDDVNHSKKVNRHYMLHGKKGDNKRISALMVFNTLYYVLLLIDNLAIYRDSLCYNSHKSAFEYISEHNNKGDVR